MSKWCYLVFSENFLLHMNLPFTRWQNFSLTKLKAYSDGKLNIAKMVISLCNRVENTVGKGNAGYQHFSLSHSVFQGLFLQGR